MAEHEGLRVTGKAFVVSILPDVCYTPPAMLPIPYIIFAKFSEGIRFADTVRMTKQNVMTTDSRLPTVYGDEPGIGGGILSGVNKGMCRPINHSKNVRAKKKNVTYNTSNYWMNCNGADGMWNTIGIAIYLEQVCSVRVGSDGTIIGDTNPPPVDTENNSNSNDKNDTNSITPMAPASKVDLDVLPPINLPPIFTPNGTLLSKLFLKGEVAVQQDGSLNLIMLSPEAFEVAASNQFKKLTSSFKVELKNGVPTLSNEVAGPLGTSEVGIKPPLTLVYKQSPKPITISKNGWKISGKMGTELEVTVIPNPPPQTVPVPVEKPAPVSHWYDGPIDFVKERGEEIVGGAIVVVGGVVILATVAEDIATLGGGTVDDPVTIGAGIWLIQTGMQYAH